MCEAIDAMCGLEGYCGLLWLYLWTRNSRSERDATSPPTLSFWKLIRPFHTETYQLGSLSSREGMMWRSQVSPISPPQ